MQKTFSYPNHLCTSILNTITTYVAYFYSQYHNHLLLMIHLVSNIHEETQEMQAHAARLVNLGHGWGIREAFKTFYNGPGKLPCKGKYI